MACSGDTKPMASTTRSAGHSRSESGTISTPEGPRIASDVRTALTAPDRRVCECLGSNLEKAPTGLVMFIAEPRAPHLQLQLMDMRGWNLRGCNLSGVDATNADFRGADLRGCDFSGFKYGDARYDNKTLFDKGEIFGKPERMFHKKDPDGGDGGVFEKPDDAGDY